jgi:hypothetical protein
VNARHPQAYEPTGFSCFRAFVALI